MRYIALLALAVLVCVAPLSPAQPASVSAKWEYAVVKWDGPDRLYYNLPGKFELVHAKTKGAVLPKDAQEEEFYLAYAANEMAKDGWEAVNLNSRRILFRRPVK